MAQRPHLQPPATAPARTARASAVWPVAAAACAVFAATSAPAPAHAGDPVRFEVSERVLLGKEKPRLTVITQVPLRRVTAQLTRDTDGKKLRLESGPLERQSSKDLTWEQPVGDARYRGTVAVEFEEGDGQMTVEFSVRVLPPPKVEVRREEVDVAAGRLTFRMDRPAQKAYLTVLGERGETLAKSETKFAGEPGGTPLHVTWKPSGTVLRIDLEAVDENGFSSALELSPWFVSIPHEEVEFESGSDVIRPSEEPKLESSWTKLDEASQRYGKLVQVKLYVVGYTDTVGPRDSNQALSERRARSIAAWFRKRGFRFPIFHQGFGEDVLAVQTPDETAEAHNRRAAYLLAGDAPVSPGAIPRSDWKRLD